MSKSELNRQISTHQKSVAAITTVFILTVVLLTFWFLSSMAAWALVATYIYADQYLTLKRLGDNPIP